MQSAADRGVRFEPPTTRRPSLVRSRLVGRLRDRFTAPVSVVVAPAGFGKTTLLAQAVAENRLAPLGIDRWLTCTVDDVAGSSLTEGLCRAMGISGAVPAEWTVDAVIEAMWHCSPRDVTLVLDDVHEVPAGSAGADVLARLVASLPGNGHVLLAGREAPPVALARLDVGGQVLRLGEADLRFTDGELAELAARWDVPARQLAGSGGWPALAELAARAVPGVEAAYIWEEVLAGIEPGRRRDLALLAHVGVFDEDLAAATLGRPVDVAALTADLPLVATTSGGGRDIHALWRPHLADVVTADEIAEARRRAGLQLARAGDAAAAVRLLTQADAWDDIVDVVVDALGAARPPVSGDVVATWLGHLPPSMADQPVARLLDAVGTVQGDPLGASERLDEAARAFREEGNAAGELACMAQLTLLAWWSEQYERLAGIVTRLFELEEEGLRGSAPLVCLARALVADVGNDSRQTLAELGRIPAGSLNQAWQSLVDWLRSTSLNHLGRPAEAIEAAERACANAGPVHAPVIESARVQALWVQGRLDEALAGLPQLVERTAATGLRNYTALAAANCCTLLSIAGRVQEAQPHLEQTRSAAPSPPVPLVDVNLAIAEAALLVASGDEAGAAAVLDRCLQRSPDICTGLAAFPQRRTLTLWYVLVPASRPVWDAETLGPYFTDARDLARLVVACRAGGLPARRPPLPGPDLTRAHLPLPWATELALAYIGAGDRAGWTLLDALWPQAQPLVRSHAGGDRASLARAARLALARLPVPPRSRLRLNLLGPVELLVDGTPIDAPEWRRQRVRSLLACLALRRPVSRERLAADLWPRLDAAAESRNLRVTLSHLLRALEPDRDERDASFLVRPHGGGVLLHRGPWFDTDVWRFDDLCQRAVEADRQGVPSAALEAMRQAVSLWRGDPTELAGEEWAVPEVEQRRLRRVDLATRAGELLLACGEPEEARQMAEAALATDPWCEPAHHIAAAAHIATGDHRAVQGALERYREALAELGMEPNESARRLQQLARSHSPEPRRML